MPLEEGPQDEHIQRALRAFQALFVGLFGRRRRESTALRRRTPTTRSGDLSYWAADRSEPVLDVNKRNLSRAFERLKAPGRLVRRLSDPHQGRTSRSVYAAALSPDRTIRWGDPGSAVRYGLKAPFKREDGSVERHVDDEGRTQLNTADLPAHRPCPGK